MEYPEDGTPFELDSPTVDLLYKAVHGHELTREERVAATRAVDYVSAAQLVIEEEDEKEDYDDNDMENPYPQDREDGEGLGLTRPSYGE